MRRPHRSRVAPSPRSSSTIPIFSMCWSLSSHRCATSWRASTTPSPTWMRPIRVSRSRDAWRRNGVSPKTSSWSSNSRRESNSTMARISPPKTSSGRSITYAIPIPVRSMLASSSRSNRSKSSIPPRFGFISTNRGRRCRSISVRSRCIRNRRPLIPLPMPRMARVRSCGKNGCRAITSPSSRIRTTGSRGSHISTS